MSSPCSHDKAYVAIIITVVPLWAVLTALIVFVLIAFHKQLRATKIYDNCTKQTANYVYHIEIRTGDTSSSYNRRKTTITIDMFDENQTTLARIAIPGNVIFGRKDAPVPIIEDERFYELRVTRLWLYRISKLKRVATIRLTHTCLDSEARIMIYGVEIRSSDSEQSKVFFPVMSYVTAYGSVNKPNACFDSEPLGSISGMGGNVEASSVSDQLSFVDYTLLVLLLSSLVFHFSTLDVLSESFKNPTRASYKGAILGLCCFSVTLLVGIGMRYVMKLNYSMKIGTGLWAIAYYFFCAAIFAPSTALWVYTSYTSYKNICSNDFSMWLLSICVAIVESVAFAFICFTIVWFMQTCSPVYAEQYVLPEDVNLIPSNASPGSDSKNRQHSRSRGHMSPPSWQSGPVPVQYMVASQPYQSPPGTGGTPVYAQPPYMMNAVGPPPTGFKTFHPPGFPGSYEQPAGQFYAMAPQMHPAPATQNGAASPAMNYHQQTTVKGIKKLGSTESTGSNYYQQLMKNKGGVKSISQYGELMKQKKTTSKK